MTTIKTGSLRLPPSLQRQFDRAEALRKAGKLAEADPLYIAILTSHPKHAPTLYARGLLAQAAGHGGPAAILLGKAAKAAGSNIRYWHSLAGLLEQMGDLHNAIAAYREIVALDPRDHAAGKALASLLLQQGQAEEALPLLQKLAAQSPQDRGILSHLALAHQQCKNFTEAEACFSRLLALFPDHVPSLINRAAFYLLTNRPEIAYLDSSRALQLAPADSNAQLNHATAARTLGHYGEALSLYQGLLAQYPTRHDIRGNYANCLMRMGKLAEATKESELAFQQSGQDPRHGYQLSRCLLVQGKLADAFDLAEHGFASGQRQQALKPPLPEWLGPQSGEKTAHLILWSDQGVGDDILMASLIPEILPAIGKLTLIADPRLHPILQPAFASWPNQVTLAASPDPAWVDDGAARQLSLGSLPRLLRRDWQAFQQSQQQRLLPLAPDPQLASHWHSYLQQAAGAKPKIGLIWGGLTTASRLQTMTRLTDWADLITRDDIFLVDLQYGDHTAALEACQAAMGHCPQSLPGLDITNDFAGLLAVVANLDLVIHVGNGLAHLAGLAGTPTWGLRLAPDAFLMGADHCPWYPKARHFLRAPGEEPGPAIQALLQALDGEFH